MSFRYQKRVNLGKGVGINVNQSGISGSYRSVLGSIGSRGFSLKTGIPGLTYRGNFGKGFLPFLLIYVIGAIVFLMAYNVVRLIYHFLKQIFGVAKSAVIKRR